MPREVLEKWAATDPEVATVYDASPVLMHFCQSRADQIGLSAAVREPLWRECALCGEVFVEDTLSDSRIARLGVEHLDFCDPCLRQCLWPTDDLCKSEQAILEYLRELSVEIGRVPTQQFAEGADVFLDVDLDARVRRMRLLERRPKVARVREVFGSWLNALIQAGLLEDGTRPTARGTQTLALDGDVCLSLGEKTIDDWLFSHGIAHEREPAYPEGGYRADWRVGQDFIEYFGLAGNSDYDARTKEKKRICRAHQINLVAVFPKDLTSETRLGKKLSVFLHEEA